MSSGESGLGKSTLINSLFLTDLYSKDYPGPSQRIKKTVQVSFLTFFQFDSASQVTLQFTLDVSQMSVFFCFFFTSSTSSYRGCRSHKELMSSSSLGRRPKESLSLLSVVEYCFLLGFVDWCWSLPLSKFQLQKINTDVGNCKMNNLYDKNLVFSVSVLIKFSKWSRLSKIKLICIYFLSLTAPLPCIMCSGHAPCKRLSCYCYNIDKHHI